MTFFEEKPQHPVSTFTAVALYYYPAAALPLVETYVRDGNNPDQPGRLVEWMYRQTPFYTWQVPGLWYDVGSKETLAEANRIFAA
ncbi:MAG: sugar phosphate nucleotidyltransferase [Pyrinomonadaceae bacterium]